MPSSEPRVALATCSRFADGDPELAGFGFHFAVWDDPAVDWSAYDLVVIRSTWDYTDKVDAFLAWTESVPRLLNDVDVVRWNHDKRYLAALHVAGVPTVSTVLDPTSLAPGRYVAKPTVSAGARDTIAGDADAALAHARVLNAAGRIAMVQPYLDGIDEQGETALVYFGGEYSHSARKGARLGLDKEDEAVSPRTPTTAELELAEQVLDTIPFDRSSLLYARVDLIPDRDGDPVLLELELIEPSLFVTVSDGAIDRLQRAIAAAL